MSERAEALRALIEKVEAQDDTLLGAEAPIIWPCLSERRSAFLAYTGSLSDAARLEAPLRERGWKLGVYWHPLAGDVFASNLIEPGIEPAKFVARGEAPAEARARLLAVLRVLLHEEERA